MASYKDFISQINKTVDEISSRGYNYPTMNSYLQDRYQYIVIGNERSGGGHLRTYKDVIEYGKSIGKDVRQFYTYQDYTKDLKAIKNLLGDYQTVEGFIESKREQYINDIERWIGEEVDVSGLSTDELRETLNNAWNNAKSNPEVYSKFASYLEQEIREAKANV